MYPEQRLVKEAVGVHGTGMPGREVCTSKPSSTPRSLIGRLTREVTYRWRLLWEAPSAARAYEMNSKTKYAERQRLVEEYARGYLEGWHECYAACLDAVEESVSQKSEIWAAGDLLSGGDGPPKMN